jgi:tetratricopeptide (TPR) repeat protein
MPRSGGRAGARFGVRGYAHYLKGDAERAIADYTRAIELRPNYPNAYNSCGVAYMAHGYGAARSVPDFDRAIALKPDFRYAYINRANARLTSHPWLALQDFHRAGMYPERKVAIGVGVVFRHSRDRLDSAKGPPEGERRGLTAGRHPNARLLRYRRAEGVEPANQKRLKPKTRRSS